MSGRSSNGLRRLRPKEILPHSSAQCADGAVCMVGALPGGAEPDSSGSLARFGHNLHDLPHVYGKRAPRSAGNSQGDKIRRDDPDWVAAERFRQGQAQADRQRNSLGQVERSTGYNGITDYAEGNLLVDVEAITGSCWPTK